MEVQNEKRRVYLSEKIKELNIEEKRHIDLLNGYQSDIENAMLEIDFMTNFDSFVDDESLRNKLGFADNVSRRSVLVVSYEMKMRESQFHDQKQVSVFSKKGYN